MTAEITLRPAAAVDLPTLHALLNRVYRGETATRSWSHEGELPAGERIGIAALAALVDDAGCRLLVAEREGRLVGSALLQDDRGGRCRIGLLGVEPDCQGAGIGDSILARAEREAARRGARTAAIEVLEHKPKLLAFYERRGYRRTGETRPYPHALATPARFLLLEKPLAEAC